MPSNGIVGPYYLNNVTVRVVDYYQMLKICVKSTAHQLPGNVLSNYDKTCPYKRLRSPFSVGWHFSNFMDCNSCSSRLARNITKLVLHWPSSGDLQKIKCTVLPCLNVRKLKQKNNNSNRNCQSGGDNQRLDICKNLIVFFYLKIGVHIGYQ